LTKLGAGTLTLAGADGYAGNTLISAGTLEFTNPNAMTASGTVTANAGTTLAIAAGGTGQFTNGTSGAGTIGGIFSNTGGQGAGVTLNNNSAVGIDTTGGSITYAGNITNAGIGLTKLGTNTLTLSGANTYTGPTLVNAGALVVSGSTAAGSAVTINSGGTLAGDGAANEGTLNGSVTVATGTPGGAINLQDGAIGTLTVGSLTVNGGTLSFDIGSGSTGNLDKIASTGTLTIGGSTKITIGFVNGTTTLTTGTYSLLTYGGAALSTANFNNLSLSSTTLGAYTLQLINGSTGSTGVELKISASTTPTTYTLATTAGSKLLHAGGSTTLTTTLTNTGTGLADSITYSGVGASTTLGTVTPGSTINGTLANGPSSVSNTANTLTTTAGTSGTATISSTGTLTNTTVGGTPTGTPTGTTVQVYSGQGVYTAAGATTSWGTAPTAAPSNWTAAGGVPGVTTGFTGVDTATFGAVSGGTTAATVNLDGANPNLNAINFTTATRNYTIAQGTGGAITLSGTTPSVNVTAGAHTISAPVSLGASTALAVASGTQLTMSGAISGAGALNNTGAGTTFLTSATGNSYTGGTTVSGGGKTYVNSGVSGTSSGTGTGAVSVTNGTLAGTGNVKTSAGLSVSGSGSLASGGVQSTTSGAVDGTHLTITDTAVTIASANLTFDLGSGTTAGAGEHTFGTPNTNTTYLSLAGSSSINFTGSDSIKLVDLTNTTGTNGSLALKLGTPYLLANASSNASYFNLVINSGTDANPIYSLSQNNTGNGYVIGVLNGGSITSTSLAGGTVTPISITQYGSDGVTQLSAGANGTYPSPALFLDNGQLEVVPEPGTWALMLGGLALLIVIQRRRNKLG
jgi:autotransporter-associated beta strand protein